MVQIFVTGRDGAEHACHAHVDDGRAAGLPPLGPDENDLLDSSDHRIDRSRLSCQVPLTVELDGLRVTIAPED